MAVAGEGDGKLGAALDVADTERREPLDQGRGVTSFRAASAQFAEVSVAPRIDQSALDQGQRLGVAASARHLHHALTRQSFHALGGQLCDAVGVTQTTVFAQTPREKLAR